MDDQFDTLPLASLREPCTLLRLVDTESIEFFELRDSIRQHGFLQSICVRPAASEPDKYEIIDGVSRYTAAKEIGLRVIPCIIKHHVSDDGVLALQIQGNAIGIDTKPSEYALHLRRLLSRNPDMTLAELGRLISKSGTWVGNVLGITNLNRETQQLVDRGAMPLQNAYMLAKLPGNWKYEYRQEACTMSVVEFKQLAAPLIKRFTEQVRQGKLDDFFCEKYIPTAHLRNLRSIKQEFDERLVGPGLVVAEDCKTPLDGFYTALRWASHLDAQSLQEQEAAFKSRQRMRPINGDLE